MSSLSYALADALVESAPRRDGLPIDFCFPEKKRIHSAQNGLWIIQEGFGPRGWVREGWIPRTLFTGLGSREAAALRAHSSRPLVPTFRESNDDLALAHHSAFCVGRRRAHSLVPSSRPSDRFESLTDSQHGFGAQRLPFAPIEARPACTASCRVPGSARRCTAVESPLPGPPAYARFS